MSASRPTADTVLPTADQVEAARNVLHGYARAVDRKDEDGLAALIADDIVLRRVDGVREGRAAFLGFYRSFFEGPVEWSKHLVTNVVVEAVPDGFAVSAYFEAVSVADGAARIVLGEYRDRLRTVDGELRIAEKNIDVQRTFQLPAGKP